jgi:hypothetical protein
VVLGEWELQAEYFEDDFLSGVSPVLFANDPQASEAAIRANPEIAKKDLDRLNRCFFVPESVELDAALKIVKKARLGDVDYVFKRKNLDRLFEPVSFNRGKTFKIIQRKINTGSEKRVYFCSWYKLGSDGRTIQLNIHENSVR